MKLSMNKRKKEDKTESEGRGGDGGREEGRTEGELAKHQHSCSASNYTIDVKWQATSNSHHNGLYVFRP